METQENFITAASRILKAFFFLVSKNRPTKDLLKHKIKVNDTALKKPEERIFFLKKKLQLQSKLVGGYICPG